MRSATEWRNVHLISSVNITNKIKIMEFQVEHSLHPFDPGSHITFTVYIDNQPHLRSYTCLPSDTENGIIRIAVKLHKNSRGGSRYMWALQPGNTITMTLPENRFELSRKAPGYLLIAGGIGITPIYSMAIALASQTSNLRMLYTAGTRNDMIFANQLQQHLTTKLDLFPTSEGKRIDLQKEIRDLPRGHELYFCGPLEMLDEARRIWKAEGHEPRNFRFEMFGDSGHSPAEPFDVEIAGYDKAVRVEQDKTLLQALHDAGIPLIYECNRGECGLCVVGITESKNNIDHRDVFFSEQEKQLNTKMCACVSRAEGGKLTIDTGYRP